MPPLLAVAWKHFGLCKGGEVLNKLLFLSYETSGSVLLSVHMDQLTFLKKNLKSHSYWLYTWSLIKDYSSSLLFIKEKVVAACTTTTISPLKLDALYYCCLFIL